MKMEPDVLVPLEEFSLSFTEKEFSKPSFTVDGFVNQLRNSVSLEQLRDDLGVYLKLLRSALIELINKDYADFLNLSSNLIGMDKAINSLMSPLEKFRTEILNVSDLIKSVETAVDEQLKEGRRIRERRSDLERLMHIIHCVEKIEKLLKISSGDKGPSEEVVLKGDVIERIASELNQLHFHVAKAQGMDLMSSIQPRIVFIANALQKSLEEDFVESLEKRDVEAIRRCLRIHVTIDRVSHLESIFRHRIVRPYFTTHVNTDLLNRPGASETDALAVLFASLLDIIPTKCSILHEASAGSAGLEVVSGFDFIVNAVWPEMVFFLETNAPSLFALGSPSTFHPRFLASMEFLATFEEMCGNLDSVRRLRAHTSYMVFINKFNLPVYFQMRFQEISCALEKSLCMCPLEVVTNSSGDGIRMHACETLMACLRQCWDEEIYLPPLVHRFAKLTLQLLSRFNVWLRTFSNKSILEEQSDKSEIGEGDAATKRRDRESMSKNFSTSDLPGHFEQNPSMTRALTTMNFADEPTPNPPHPDSSITLDQAVCLVADLGVIRNMVPKLMAEMILPKVKELGVVNLDIIKECMEESLEEILRGEQLFAEKITAHLIAQASGHLKFITDIPRLFRRTNREAPTKPSSYIHCALKPISDFREAYKWTLSQERMRDSLKNSTKILAEQLFASTKEVLTSVQKMEESLKRLKRMKAGARSEDSPTKTGQKIAMTDDEKIRHQLWLDAKFFADQTQDVFGVQLDIVSSLVELVEEAKARGLADH